MFRAGIVSLGLLAASWLLPYPAAATVPGTKLVDGAPGRKSSHGGSARPRFAVATMPTPLLNTPRFHSVFGGKTGTRLALDKVGLVRAIEMVCLPETPFEILQILNDRGRTIYRVTTEDYPYPSAKGYYIDAACVRTSTVFPGHRPRKLPHPVFIRYRLESCLGALYVWGGNWHRGIPRWFSWYPFRSAPRQERLAGRVRFDMSVRPAVYGPPPARRESGLFDPGYVRKTWCFRGVDCSGLIYEATGGWTPRNASSLIRYGKAVHIAGLDADGILSRVRPLDILGWRTHVMIFLDTGHIIQSRVDYDYDKPGNQGGVRIQDARKYLTGLMKSYDPVDDYDDEVPQGRRKFVIRRWYGTESRAR